MTVTQGLRAAERDTITFLFSNVMANIKRGGGAVL